MIQALTNHLWQTTVFAAAVAVLTLAFRRNRAHLRYWLWFSASLKFLIPFALLIALGTRFQPAQSAIVAFAPAPVRVKIIEISEPVVESAPPFHPEAPPRDRSAVLASAWALGFAAVVLMRVRAWRRIRSAVRSSAPTAIAAPVEVRSSPELFEPGVVGVWRPILLLPAGIADRLTPEQLEAILAHELCHVRRRDNLLASIHMLVEALFWFHPLMWWIGARLIAERERACDEAVLSLGNDARVYAEGILNVSKRYLESPLACVAGVTGADLKKRIEAIMSERISHNLNFTRKAVLVTAAIAAVAAPLVIGLLKAPRTHAAPLKFDEVSINRACEVGERVEPAPGRLNYGCATVAQLISKAYVYYADGHAPIDSSILHYVDAVPVEGPGWIFNEQYHISARAPGAPDEPMMRGPMMQTLLEDHFKLKVRRETRQVPGYVLTVAPGGPKMQPYTGDCVPDEVPPPLAPGRKHCYEIGAGARLGAAFTPRFGPDTGVKNLDELALWLFGITDRPTLNKTGLTGKFFMSLAFAPDSSTPGALTRIVITARREGESEPEALRLSNPPGPSIFMALEQQLGLKLEPTTTSRDFLVVEHVERP